MGDESRLRLERFQPCLRYDSLESYFADSAEEWTANPENRLRRQDGGTVPGPGDLSLGFLGPEYPDHGTASPSDCVESTSSDYSRQYRELREARQELRNVIYGRAVPQGDSLWLQYWFFYFVNDYPSSPITWLVMRVLARFVPGLVAGRFDGLLAGMTDDGYANVSYKVFNIGQANHLPGYSMELAVPLEGNRHVECIDRLLEIAAERRAGERLHHTSPIALRFVAPSRAFASMMHDRATMMIELIMIDGTRGGERLLAGYEQRLGEFDVRPHWGQLNALTRDRIAALYPRWEDWLAVQRRFNASGVFDSPFARRAGITIPA